MENIAQAIAKDLLKVKAVFFRPEEPFTWASGIKSPVYCDNRLTLTAPEVRTDVENALAETIRREYPDAEVLMGTSTAGIAHAAITGHLLNLPMGYVRSGSKDHGRQNQIEGRLEKGQKVVVVEDLISTAGSVLEVVSVLLVSMAVGRLLGLSGPMSRALAMNIMIGFPMNMLISQEIIQSLTEDPARREILTAEISSRMIIGGMVSTTVLATAAAGLLAGLMY